MDSAIGQTLHSSKLTVMNEIINRIIESWNTPYTFNDLALKNTVFDEIVIKIQEVQR
jgi:hypothetical protein